MCLFEEGEYKEAIGDEKYTTGLKVVLPDGDGFKSLAFHKPINRFGETIAESSDPRKSVYFLAPSERTEKFLLNAICKNRQDLLVRIKPLGRQWHELPIADKVHPYRLSCSQCTIQICTCEKYKIIEEVGKIE